MKQQMRILTKEEWNVLITNKDYTAIINQCQGMVKKMSDSFVRTYMNKKLSYGTMVKGELEELFNHTVQIANITIWKCVDMFDINNATNATFLTYAKAAIKNEIIRDYQARQLRESRFKYDPLAYIQDTHGVDEYEQEMDYTEVLNAIDIILKPKEAKLLKEYYGINCEPADMKTIAKRYGISHQAISEKLIRIMKTLKTNKDRLKPLITQ